MQKRKQKATAAAPHLAQKERKRTTNKEDKRHPEGFDYTIRTALAFHPQSQRNVAVSRVLRRVAVVVSVATRWSNDNGEPQQRHGNDEKVTGNGDGIIGKNVFLLLLLLGTNRCFIVKFRLNPLRLFFLVLSLNFSFLPAP